jgi:hypothetical protein
MSAPTASEILAAGHDLLVACDRCRLLVDMNWARRKIIQQGRGDVPVDQLSFKSSRCHRAGQPLVRGRDRPTIWPPGTQQNRR